MNFEALIDDLKSAHGENLASVVLYGSAAAGDFVPQASDFNLLIALKRITPLDLRNSNAVMREWTRLGYQVPAYFTVGELQTAADVFPIEFHHMAQSRKILFGSDVLAGLDLTTEFLRHQAEYELRSKLIKLRRAYIPASASVEGIVNLMSESISSFAALFGAYLLVKGIKTPVGKRAILAQTVAELKLDGRPFEKILNIRAGNFTERLDDVSANELFGDYLAQIEAVIAAVDELKKD